MTAVATAIVGSAVIGGAVSMAGAKKSAKAMDRANEANRQMTAETNQANKQIADEANRLNYQMWLESRGIDRYGNPVNTKLPRWAVTGTTPSTVGFRIRQRTPYSGSITAPRTRSSPSASTASGTSNTPSA